MAELIEQIPHGMLNGLVARTDDVQPPGVRVEPVVFGVRRVLAVQTLRQAEAREVFGLTDGQSARAIADIDVDLRIRDLADVVRQRPCRRFCAVRRLRPDRDGRRLAIVRYDKRRHALAIQNG
jgi:hypothetical protein